MSLEPYDVNLAMASSVMMGEKNKPGTAPRIPQTTLQPDSGFRFHWMDPLPSHDRIFLDPPPCRDWGNKPIYISSAIFNKSVHPCKVRPHQPCSVAFRGREIHSKGHFDPLPFNPDTMELVRTSEGRVPDGRRLIKGSYEENGMPLYHGAAEYKGHRAPGKTSPYLNGRLVSFDWSKHLNSTKNHEIFT
ncbi:hypothetical protein EV421DRAFT_1145417 [Armillaria borealis]|uniref:Uncharacterized protein n=1 Tax=Armillaria borealis TaxID=47425 RepID=A0AA39J4G4_9AGAR|nr:hypothetical protein EV421DRAFT_1145417 [Armillaria borealis]